MHSFFCPDLSSGSAFLDADESAHASRVLRLREGDDVILLDGKGVVAEAKLSLVSNQRCELSVVHSQAHEARTIQLHVAIAPTKMNDRTEWFLEKAVELGVESITPVICDRSERRVVNHERFLKVVKAAVKQSLQPYLPELRDAVSLKEFLKQSQQGFIAHCADDYKNEFSQTELLPGMCTVLIGPEGDFAPDEIRSAVSLGWKPVRLGASRLRTETAGVYVAAVVRMLNEKFRHI